MTIPYEPEANYVCGLINTVLGNDTDAKDGFSIASFSLEYRSAAYTKLSQCYLKDKDWIKAEHYALKCLETNALNLDGIQSLLVAYRYSKQTDKSKELIRSSLHNFPLNHPVRYETYLLDPNEKTKNEFTSLIRSEFPDETYMDIALWYESVGCSNEALNLFQLASAHPIANYHAAYLLQKLGKADQSRQMLDKAITLLLCCNPNKLVKSFNIIYFYLLYS